MKASGYVGRVVTLKLKTGDFKTITRRHTLPKPSNLARTAYDAAAALLAETAKGIAYRLIGVGYSDLIEDFDEAQVDLFGEDDDKLRREENAIDAIRRKFGDDAIALGRSYAKKPLRTREKNDDGENDE